MGGCHRARLEGRWLHSGVKGRQGVAHGLLGQTLLPRHGHHDGRGCGRGRMGVHLLQLGCRPGAVFGRQHVVLLLELLVVVVEVASGCGGRQGDLTSLAALGGHSRLHRGEGRGERSGELGGELGLVPSRPHLLLLRGGGGDGGGRGCGSHADVGGWQCASPVLSVLWRGVWVGGWGGDFILEGGNDCVRAER